jgi:hypothetical protein
VRAGDPEAKEVNRCRSLAKDYWEFAYSWLDRGCHCSDRKLEYLKDRHTRFVQEVKKITPLPNYKPGAEDYLFADHERFGK